MVLLGLLKFVDRGNGSSIRLKIGESEEEVLSPWRVRFSYVIMSWFNIVAVSVSSSFLIPIVMLFSLFLLFPETSSFGLFRILLQALS